MTETRDQKAERMAYLLTAVTRERGKSCDDNLREAGFTEDEIQDLYPMACGIAALSLDNKIFTH